MFHHGSGGLLPAAKPGIETLVAMGYAVFVAIRRGHNRNPGPFWESLVTAPWGSPEMGPQLVAALTGGMRRRLIQAGDDVHLTPTYVLGGELARLGRPYESRICQTIGNQRGDGHGVFNKAMWLWEQDVERFLARWMSPAAPTT